MKRCAFLTMDDLGSHVNDDALAMHELRQKNWDVQSVSWRNTEANWNTFDIVVIRSPWDYTDEPESFLKTLEGIAASNTRLENSLEMVRWNIDKRYLLDLQEQGINVVPTLFGSRLTRLRFSEIAGSFGDQPFVIKPVISASAKNTFLISSHNTPLDNIIDAFSGTDYMVQPFMQHILQEGEFSLFFFSGKYSHCIRKKPKRNDFRVQEELGGQITPHHPSSRLLDNAHCILGSLTQNVLYARIDLVRDENGDYALMELELIEPSLYLRMDPHASTRFANAIDAIPC